MPAKAPNTAKKNTGSSLSLFISIASGVFAFATISLVISRIGVLPIPTLLFSGLSGLAVAGFVGRERSLLKRLEVVEQHSVEQIAQLESELNYLYESSVVSLVEYDAGNLIVGRVSSGFFQLMGFDARCNVQGKEVHTLLGVDATQVERLTERIKHQDLREGTTLSCRRDGGDVLELTVSGRFAQDSYMIELSLVCSPDNFKKYAELQQMMDDLERFRKGMLRREKRIIDLKTEVNSLLVSNGTDPRYAITAATGPGRIADMLTGMKVEKDPHE